MWWLSKGCKRFYYTVLLSVVAWMLGLSYFVSQIPKEPEFSMKKVDAAVVLTGGSKRIHHGFERVTEDLASQIFISGVGDVTTPEYIIGKAIKRNEAVKEKQITLGYEARTTIGNADEVRKWVVDNNIESIRLITANYHMPRSKLEISNALPNDILILPDPVFPQGFDISRWLSDTNSRRLVMSEYHKFLASLARHILMKFYAAKPHVTKA